MFLRYRTIKFSGVFVLVLTLIMHVLLYNSYMSSNLAILKLAILPAAYLVLCLYTDDIKGIGAMFAESWNISCMDIENEQERISMLRDYVEGEVNKWSKYWRLWEKIHNGGDPVKGFIEEFKYFMKRIYTGEMNIIQGFWMFVYVAYSALETGVFPMLAPWLDLIITFGILLVILFYGGSIRGTGKFMEDFFRALKRRDEKMVKNQLRIIEIKIKTALRKFYFSSASREKLMKERELLELDKLCEETTNAVKQTRSI